MTEVVLPLSDAPASAAGSPGARVRVPSATPKNASENKDLRVLVSFQGRDRVLADERAPDVSTSVLPPAHERVPGSRLDELAQGCAGLLRKARSYLPCFEPARRSHSLGHAATFADRQCWL